MNQITLQWKPYPIKVDKVKTKLKTLLSSNFDGLVCDSESLSVVFLEEISQQDIDLVSNYWSNLTAQDFQPSMEEIIQSKIDGAITFGQSIIREALISNVALGITQSGKTREVSDYLTNLQRYLREGSLYAAMEEIDYLVNNTVPEELAPFVTAQKLNDVKAKILTYVTI